MALTFHNASAEAPAECQSARNRVVVVGTQASLRAPEAVALLQRLTAASDAHADLFRAAVRMLGSPGTKPKTAEVVLPPAEGAGEGEGEGEGAGEEALAGRSLVVGMLPTACSRHNTPTQAHAVTDIMKTAKGAAGSSADGMTVLLLPEEYAHFFAQGCAVARAFPLYGRSQGFSTPEVRVFFGQDYGDADDAQSPLSRVQNYADGVRFAARLVDMPTSELNASTYVEEAQAVAERLGCGIEVIQGEELNERGFGGMWGVGRASTHLPAMVILSHTPEGTDENTKSVVWVGKGIVYDTGGLSIKTKTGMPGMKRDMGGSAAILAAFEATIKSGCTCRLHAILCIAENSVGPEATRPDDILSMYSGRTVEVNNTDAEGRLVLGDGVAYAARHLKPRIIVDMATLTGAQGIATGKRHAALYCNDDDLEALAVRVGRATGDLTHPLPYCPEFFADEFRSSVADMKNSVANRSNAQASCAGQFIGNHLQGYLQKHGNHWLHIDMAAAAYTGERATGYGVALLGGLIEEIQKD